jgi:hypothetical protein
MSRAWRGAWARRGTLATLAGVMAVVVAGTVSVLGYAALAESSVMLSAPLLLLGLIAVPSAGQELGRTRREEIGVARLRGLEGRSLLRMVSIEPAGAIVLGGLVGYGLGLVVLGVATREWLGVATWWSGWRSLAVALGVGIVALGAVLVGMAGTLREPLSDQVSLADRPRAGTTAGLFVNLLVLAAAAVAIYRSAVVHTADPDWVVLLGPALVGVAAGQVAVWVLGLVTRAGAARSGRSSLPTYLAVRRLRSSAGLRGPLRTVVAASVVATVALSGAGRVSEWSSDTARLRAVGPVQVPFEGGAVRALELTRSLDPDGRWLMAAASVLDPEGGPGRRAYLDIDRYDAVVGDQLAGTPAAGLASVAGDLRPDAPGIAEPVRIVHGDGLRVSLVPRGIMSGHAIAVTLAYLNDQGFVTRAVAVLPVAGPRPEAAEVALPDCRLACTPTALTVSEGALTDQGEVLPRRPSDSSVLLTELTIGDSDLLDQGWADDESPDQTLSGPAGVPVLFGRSPVRHLVPVVGVLPVLVTDALRWPDQAQQVKSPGGITRPVSVAGSLPALPLVEGSGVLADLSRSLLGDAPVVPAAEVVIIARAGTPAALLDQVRAAGGETPRSLLEVRRDLDAATGAGQAAAYTLMAAFCLAMAALVLGASAVRQRAERRREIAALRVLNVSAAQVRRTGRTELGLLGAITAMLAVAGGTAAGVLLLSTLPLVRLPEFSLELRDGIPWWAPVVAGLTALLMLIVILGGARRLSPRATRPAILREEAGG